jgi:hypothetical protein
MSPELRNKQITTGFYVFLVLVIGLAGYFGLSARLNQPKTPPPDSETLAEKDVIELLQCVDHTQEICIVSTGFDASGNLLISLKTKLAPLPALVARVTQNDYETALTCQPVEASPGLVYCLGPYSDQNQVATVEIYTRDDDQLLATGELAAGGQTLRPTVPPEAPTTVAPSPTPEPTFDVGQLTPQDNPIVVPTVIIPAYPNPSYPTYP